MKLPIIAYGDPVLRKEGDEIDKDYPSLQELIDNMFETMYNAPGVGLAAPQVGLSIRLFVVDSRKMFDEEEEDQGIVQTFLNAKIVEQEGSLWSFEEGCLSIPKITENVDRQPKIRIQYYDRDWNFHDETYDGLNARVIQHEYDHIDGVLFTDHLKPLKKRLLRGKLNDISKGNISVDYKMKFPKAK